MIPFPILDTQPTEDTFASHLLDLIEEYVADHDAITQNEAAEWVDDL